MVNFQEITVWSLELFHGLIILFSAFKDTENFGANSITLLFLITLGLTTANCYSFFKQNRQIVADKSGASVSLPLYAFTACSTFTVYLYGLYRESLALAINGIALCFFSAWIVINLLRYQDNSRREKTWVVLSILVIPVYVLSPDKDIASFCCGLVVLAMLAKQIWQLWESKLNGSLHPAPMIISILNSSFWLWYGFEADIWTTKIFHEVSLPSWILFLILYIAYRKNKKGADI